MKDWKTLLRQTYSDLKKAKQKHPIIDKSILPPEKMKYLEAAPCLQNFIRESMDFRHAAYVFLELDYANIMDMVRNLEDQCEHRLNQVLAEKIRENLANYPKCTRSKTKSVRLQEHFQQNNYNMINIAVHTLRNTLNKKITALQQVRHLNLLEFQSKDLLQKYNVAIQQFKVLDNSGKDVEVLKQFECPEYVVKAQILAGGRGKGTFDNGFKGGVHITTKKDEVLDLTKKMIGNRLITKQTPKSGIMVKKVMVARSVNIVRETYLCILLDREHNGPVLIASPAGGVDIEAVAEETPEKILTIPLDIDQPIPQETLEKVAKFLEFKGKCIETCAQEIQKLFTLFKAVDAVQIEINPLAETDNGEVISVDAKLNFDDNAQYRQKEIFAMDISEEESDPREIEAAKHNLNYVAMDGNIGCLVNGAGLAMATMDIIKLNGGDPANFLDVGGGVKEDQVLKAFEILTSDPKVKGILVNVFGGIVNCATIANGVVAASKKLNLNVPLVVRLEGTNVDEARQILKKSGLAIQTATDLDDAAQKAVAALK
ncbi:succinyl-coenzyme A synthetase beta subunit, GDP-forming isoform X2 [Musca autumnalis]